MNHSPDRLPAATRSRRFLVGGIAAAVVVAVAIGATRGRGAPTAASDRSAPAQLELVHAERFHVDRPFRHAWRADRPAYQDGWLLVLAGDPALLQPRQARQPVLFVGAQVADRINAGTSGKLVVLVPGEFALADAPIFFGGDTLPEELRQPQIDAELAQARAAGALPPSAPALTNAVREGVQVFADDHALRLRAIDLVEQHSPAEKALIEAARVPLVK